MTNELDELAERVRALEERLAGLPSPADPVEPAVSLPKPAIDPENAAEVFWALEGLAARGPDAVLYAGSATPAGQGPVRWQITRSSAELLAEDWAERAATISALGHPVRLRILQLVVSGEATTAAELAAAEGLGSTGQIYHHLRQLVAAGWLRATSRGHHDVPAERVVPLLAILSAAR
jgi:DNA-binding transcriptional ArsR family regulator